MSLGTADTVSLSNLVSAGCAGFRGEDRGDDGAGPLRAAAGSGPSAHRHERSPEDPGVAHLTTTNAQANDLGGR